MRFIPKSTSWNVWGLMVVLSAIIDALIMTLTNNFTWQGWVGWILFDMCFMTGLAWAIHLGDKIDQQRKGEDDE